MLIVLFLVQWRQELKQTKQKQGLGNVNRQLAALAISRAGSGNPPTFWKLYTEKTADAAMLSAFKPVLLKYSLIIEYV